MALEYREDQAQQILTQTFFSETFNNKGKQRSSMDQKKYCGTYHIRRIGKSECGIHMPCTLTGAYSIYLNEKDGMITLAPQTSK